MDVVDLLAELGGVARRSAILRVIDRAELDRAVAGGELVRRGRGLYALPEVDAAVLAAARLGGVLSLTSAALSHGWAVKTLPDRPHVTVSRGRKVNPDQSFAHLHRAELRGDQVVDGRTDVETTLEQCSRVLPYDEALAIADSARREGVGANFFERLAERAKGCSTDPPGMRERNQQGGQPVRVGVARHRRGCAGAQPGATGPDLGR